MTINIRVIRMMTMMTMTITTMTTMTMIMTITTTILTVIMATIVHIMDIPVITHQPVLLTLMDTMMDMLRGTMMQRRTTRMIRTITIITRDHLTALVTQRIMAVGMVHIRIAPMSTGIITARIIKN